MGSAYDAPAVRGREAAGGKEAQSGGAPAEQQQQQQEKGLPALRRWALWSDQAKPYTSPLDHLLSIEGSWCSMCVVSCHVCRVVCVVSCVSCVRVVLCCVRVVSCRV